MTDIETYTTNTPKKCGVKRIFIFPVLTLTKQDGGGGGRWGSLHSFLIDRHSMEPSLTGKESK